MRNNEYKWSSINNYKTQERVEKRNESGEKAGFTKKELENIKKEYEKNQYKK